MFAVSAPNAFPDGSYNSQTVFGISGGDTSYVNGQYQGLAQTTRFYAKEENLFDMILDLNKLELRFKLVDEDHEVKISNLTANFADGWVPHMNIYYSPGNVQMKKIPMAWYGKGANRVKFQY